MGAGFEIVPMKKEHAAAAAEIEKLCFSQPWSREAIEEELENPGCVFFAAVFGETVGGYAGMQVVCGEGYLFNVAVRPEFRRRGAATALLGALSLVAQKNRMAFLTLEVREHNAAARALYQKEGFAVEGRRRNFYTCPDEDGLIMTKRFGGNES